MTPVMNYQNDNSCVNSGQFESGAFSALNFLLSHSKISASHDSSERQTQAKCLPETRADILDQIHNWVDSSDDRPVCWLYGSAGCGKTTLATTIAAEYTQKGRLAGSFFFSRDRAHHRQSINAVIATIAYQNAISHPVIWNRIKRVLVSDPDIFTKSLKIQFDRLLVDPARRRRLEYIAGAHRSVLLLCKAWATLHHRFDLVLPGGAQTFCEVCIAFLSYIIFHPPIDGVAHLVIIIIMAASLTRHPTIQNAIRISFKAVFQPPPLVVIIDALDECDDFARSLVQVIAGDYRDSPVPIRFILTSRQDEEIAGAFRRHRDKILFMNLMEFPAHEDIRLFLQKEFNNLTIKHSQYLGSYEKSWPSPADINLFVNKSQGIFLYPSTLLNFVGDMDQGEIPDRRMKRAMLQNDGLDALYCRVLQDAPEFLNPNFHRLLGALCFLYNTMSLGSLVVLLRLDSASNARRILRGCRSVLHIPQTDHEDISFVHMSLYDFLIDRDRSQILIVDACIDNWIDPTKQHLSLLYDCIQFIVTESRTGLINESSQVKYSVIADYAWANWHRHLIDLQPSGRGTVDLLKRQFGEHYESLFLYFLDRLGDGTLQRAMTWPDLEPNLLRLEDKELSDRIQRILRFKILLSDIETKGRGVTNEARAPGVDYGTSSKCQYNVAMDRGDEAQTETDEPFSFHSTERWSQSDSKANTLVAKKNDVDVISEGEGPEDNHPPDPEHQPKIRQVHWKHIIIYTGVDMALKTLERPIDVIFTLTPPTADSDKPWAAIVWKTFHFDKTTTMQNKIRWSSQSGFCVVEELDDGTLRPGDLGTAVEPGHAAILQGVHNELNFSRQLAMPFATNDVAVCDMTGFGLHLALCFIDSSKEDSDMCTFSPVVDLVSSISSGGHVLACKPPTMLQAYAVSGYKDQQPIDSLELLSPLFVNTRTAEPQAIDLSTLERPVTTFRLYSSSTGKVTLEED